MSDLIKASNFKPRIFPIGGDCAPAEIDRAQDITPDVNLNREKLEEIGTLGAIDYIKKSPTITYKLTQNEYGNIEFYQKLVNSDVLGSDSENPITLESFNSAYSDIVAYMSDDDGTFKGTYLYPSLRTDGFSFTIGDPQAIIQRSFSLVGEVAKICQGDNKYYIEVEHVCTTGTDDEISLATYVPAEDPDNAGVYMFRVVRVNTDGVEELTSDEYTYNPTTLTIDSVETDDIIKVYYTSATAPATIFTTNTSDPGGLLGDCVDIYLYVPASGKPSASDYIYRLQNVGIDVTFDRNDIREVGNKDVVARGVKNSTVKVTLGKILSSFTLEEVLRGEAVGYGVIDVSKLSSDISLIVKVYDDNTKTTFKYGFMAEGLSPTTIGGGMKVSDYGTVDNALEGEDLTITADETLLA